ncbi:MAG: dihydropteroate synthase [Flavobacteriia bacterium]|nr:dihydropteroate synthase [Flavobacteriia bacterium]OIP48511.1 MAG: dihydropteroate synthase [Flavobacteriaceae bacterium CG2_30_31_66]PIV97330.1 MAG: dihydropteroate synthase [Flavobacteriaceae bacterium CG17_big_fil_post_rev_8_21_14_2_50_31_13]PIX13496.1 MAG: dihydropteroate synthase [Flavobacteriaceae bacterium CG_4_8_14_3_um_filter_31_8]PIY15015.1 MAG: dihydropteroate synthase [Flavobacteriaceae bacterium CG_4_10_14_3_um_filter_31_253]PIZ09622.1 MAG: dihydropteroate synthase [Flavobacter
MTINCKGNLIDVSSPKVMGILNITPDSFYDGGKYKNESDILFQTEKMLKEGASFIDVGAYSSRPGAADISEKEELKRILPVVNLLVKNFPEIILSVDTFRSEIAKETIQNGAAIINDISGGKMDENMFQTVAELQVPYILMHMLGTPQNMQQNPVYEDITTDIIRFFSEQIFKLHQLKVNDIIIDMGFGFGKTLQHNYEILSNLTLFKNLDAPILIGVSRKSMLYKPLDITANEALNATTVANTIALLNGANMLRVHDVKEAVEAIKIVNQLEL